MSDEDHPKRKRKEKIPQAIRNAVWNKYAGSDVAKCLCYTGCGETISRANFECGHVLAEAHGGPVNVENLRPICSLCNKSMGTMCMLDFILVYKLKSPQDKTLDVECDPEDVSLLKDLEKLDISSLRFLYEKFTGRTAKRKKNRVLMDLLEAINSRNISAHCKWYDFATKGEMRKILMELQIESLLVLLDVFQFTKKPAGSCNTKETITSVICSEF